MVGENLIIEAKGLLLAGEAHPLDLQLAQRDTLCLIGPDSKRLKHALRTLAGVEAPHAGELLLFGRPLAGLDKRSWREQRQHIGYVAQGAPLLSVLRGLDNVTLPALYHRRFSRLEAQARAMGLLAELDCRGDIHQLPAYLSTLQRLQLAIARATILEPAVLFVEEPFHMLSIEEQQPVSRYFINSRELRAQVITTHNLSLVKSTASQVLFIGQQASYHFDSWQTLLSSQIDEVASHLTLYRQQNPLS